MRVRWSPIEAICLEAVELGGQGLACWVEDGDGKVVAGSKSLGGEKPVRASLSVAGAAGGHACSSGANAAAWVQFVANAVERELEHQATVNNMADATARLWKHMNGLMRMAATTKLSFEPARIVANALEILSKSTRLLRGVGVVRLPGQDTCTVFRHDGVDTVDAMILAPLHAVTDEVRLVSEADADNGLFEACSTMLGAKTPLAMARLATDHERFGFILAPIESADDVTSEDLKMFASVAQIISVAVENGLTLSKEREAMRLQVENELLSHQTRDMEEMVHVVAHDLRSPMTALYGFLHVALDELKDMRGRLEAEGYAPIGPYEDRIAEPLRDGIGSVEKLNRMVQRLLDFSKAARGAYSFEKVALSKLAQGVIRSLGYQLTKRDIEVQIGDLPAVTGDRIQLEAVFGNLIDNAIKYIGDKPSPVISVGCESGPEPIYFVRDTGIGMSPDEVSKAFIPFQRFHGDAAPGDGIGLPHVRKIIERHGGRIWCESEQNVGTTFYFTLGARVPEGRLAESFAVHKKRTEAAGASESSRADDPWSVLLRPAKNGNGHASGHVNGHNGHNGSNGHAAAFGRTGAATAGAVEQLTPGPQGDTAPSEVEQGSQGTEPGPCEVAHEMRNGDSATMSEALDEVPVAGDPASASQAEPSFEEQSWASQADPPSGSGEDEWIDEAALDAGTVEEEANGVALQIASAAAEITEDAEPAVGDFEDENGLDVSGANIDDGGAELDGPAAVAASEDEDPDELVFSDEVDAFESGDEPSLGSLDVVEGDAAAEASAVVEQETTVLEGAESDEGFRGNEDREAVTSNGSAFDAAHDHDFELEDAPAAATQVADDAGATTSPSDGGEDVIGGDTVAEVEADLQGSDGTGPIDDRSPDGADLEGCESWARDEAMAMESETPFDTNEVVVSDREQRCESEQTHSDSEPTRRSSDDARRRCEELDDDVISALAYGAGIVAYATDTSADGGEEATDTTRWEGSGEEHEAVEVRRGSGAASGHAGTPEPAGDRDRNANSDHERATVSLPPALRRIDS